VLQDVPPGVAPLGVVAQRGQRHPQVARGEAAELDPQPAGGSAVVRHRDHGGQVARHVPERLQGGGKAVPTPEGDHLQPGHHSLPRSRWSVRTAWPAARNRPAISSLMATERCLPPVQPTAIVT